MFDSMQTKLKVAVESCVSIIADFLDNVLYSTTANKIVPLKLTAKFVPVRAVLCMYYCMHAYNVIHTC